MEANQVLERAKDFVYNNARLLDRKRYEYHFEGGAKEGVIGVLRAYQNPDGGFGNALEPDIRCPQSQPVPTEMALAIMDEVGGFDPVILEGMEGFLRELTLAEGGFPFVLRSVNGYPHAPWWKTTYDKNPSINPTGQVIGYLYKQKVRTSMFEEEWFQRNVGYIWRLFEREKPDGYHDGVQWLTFLQNTPDRERADTFWPIVDKWLGSRGTIELNPRADGYVHKVLDWAPSPDAYSRKFVSDEDVKKHLQALVDEQQEDGGWPMSWPPVSPATEQEWRGWITVERLKTLKAYGVLTV